MAGSSCTKRDGLAKKDSEDTLGSGSSSSGAKPYSSRAEYLEAVRGWLSRASNDALRAYLRAHDGDQRYADEMKMLDEELNRRTRRDYEGAGQGEWI